MGSSPTLGVFFTGFHSNSDFHIQCSKAVQRSQSRLAQSVERQTLKSLPEFEGYLNVVGSSPTLGGFFVESELFFQRQSDVITKTIIEVIP